MDTADMEWLTDLIEQRLDDQGYADLDAEDVDDMAVSDAALKLLKEIDASIAHCVNDEDDEDEDDEDEDEDDASGVPW